MTLDAMTAVTATTLNAARGDLGLAVAKVHAKAGPDPSLQAKLLLGLVLFLVLWVAWRIGRFVLRILAGLAFLGLVAYVIWYLFYR